MDILQGIFEGILFLVLVFIVIAPWMSLLELNKLDKLDKLNEANEILKNTNDALYRIVDELRDIKETLRELNK